MSLPAIRVRQLSKEYRIGGPAAYQTLRDSIADWFRGSSPPAGRQTFWALQDLEFTVPPGETVAIIGANGAGKSTLLKILSRITAPTTGRAEVRGRMASLIEVGTGFHRELTGRENVFLNGAILGMQRREIEARFDEIVDFAGVEQFLDTAVKHYSSGMYLRLAFSVAAHLNTEVLVVDEVLAVGDAEFQRKCLGQMERAAAAGRTVLFVSHNMPAVRNLCRRGLRLQAGRLVDDGPAEEVVDRYLRSSMDSAKPGEVFLDDWSGERSSPGDARIVAVRARNPAGEPAASFFLDDPLLLEAEVANAPGGFIVIFIVEDASGTRVYYLRSDNAEASTEEFSGRSLVRVRIPHLRAREGNYYVTVWLGNRLMMPEDRVNGALQFEIVNNGMCRRPIHAVIMEPGEWEVLGCET